ncbi:MAG: ABC transporter permease [Defluviitaleaceae bacterium]|nr:ABC transporter permease [Defluviitaleaceae bacterium]
MDNKSVLLENNIPLDSEFLNLSREDFELLPREEKILDVEFKGESVSYAKDVWRRFLRSPITVVSAAIIAIIVLMGIVGPYLSGFTAFEQRWDLGRLPPRWPGFEHLGIFDGSTVREIQAANLPNWEPVLIRVVEEFEVVTSRGPVPMLRIRIDAYAHAAVQHAANIEQGLTPDPTDMYFLFGTDQLGRCLFSRLWQGTRVSLILGFSAVLINLAIGMIMGSAMGYYGGKFDMIAQRIMEVIVNIPFLPLCLILIMLLGSGMQTLIIIFLINGWIPVANNVRIQFYRFKNREYVLASRTMGASDKRVMFRHILPNAIGTTITFVALSVPTVIMTEAFLAYLGLGIEAPNPSIGVLLRNGQENLLTYPFMMLFPGIVIVLLMLAFNLLGNGLRDAFNPALRK